jgi:hypothetical protein
LRDWFKQYALGLGITDRFDEAFHALVLDIDHARLFSAQRLEPYRAITVDKRFDVVTVTSK